MGRSEQRQGETGPRGGRAPAEPLADQLRGLYETLSEVDLADPRPIDLSADGRVENPAVHGIVEKINEIVGALRENENRLRDFAEAASDWFWEADERARIVYVSDHFVDWTGIKTRDLLGLTPREFDEKLCGVLGEDAERGLLRLNDAILSQKPFRDLPGKVITPRGTVRVMTSGKPCFDARGRFVGARGVTVNRSEIFEANRAKLRMAEELAHAEKLQAIGQLTGGVAHDFNNLLGALMGYLDLAELMLADDQVEPALESIRSAQPVVHRGAALTHRMLAYARKQPLMPTPIDSGALVLGLKDMMRRTLGAAIELAIAIDPDAWPCFADGQQLETVLLNLAINSRDAMPDGGRLEIRVSNTRIGVDPPKDGAAVRPGEYVGFTVRDRGVGMTEEVVARAFDPFYTTKPEGVGSGLGLSMAYGFAQQSEGYIKIDSEPGAGTTVELLMPRSPHEAGPPRDSEQAVDESPVFHPAKIMVVEDDDSLREVTVRHLRQAGYQTIDAVDGPSALARAALEPSIDLFLIDVVLSATGHGYDAWDELSRLFPHAGVLFMSGYDEHAVERLEGRGDNLRRLNKPYTRDALLRGVGEALESLGAPVPR